MILSVCAATLPYAQPPGTYGTSARRGPGGCGWPMAITHAHEDPALSPARPCAAPHRVSCGAPGGEVPHPAPQARTARARRARLARAGRPYGPLHPHPGIPRRSQSASTSKKLGCWLINDPPKLAASPGCSSWWARARCCGPTRVEDDSATVAARAFGPYMATERKSEASTTRASPPLTAWPTPRRTQRRTSGPRCA